MSDEDLRKLLRNTLGGRRMPEEVRTRVLARLRRGRPAAALLAAAVVMGALLGSVFLLTSSALPSAVAAAMDQHLKSSVFEHPAAARTPREIGEVVQDAIGRRVDLPSLRDAGFSCLQAHNCAHAGAAHVIYANHWLKLSCFVFSADVAGLDGGLRLNRMGVEARVFSKGTTTAVAIRDGGVVKVWVSDLRAEQVAAIAVDAEQKRHLLTEAVLQVPSACVKGPMEAILQQMPGVEEVQMEASGAQIELRFDPRRVSADEILAVMRLNEIEATWGGGEGR